MSTEDQLALDWTAPADTARMAPVLARARPAHQRRRKPTAPVIPAPSCAPVDEPIPLNRCGRPRTIATQPGYGTGRPPVTKGRKYPPDPVTAEDVDAMLKHLEHPRSKYENRVGNLSRLRLRAIIALLWRSGLRISEALDLEPRDLNPNEFCLTVRHGKGDKRRISAMDEWAWAELRPWLSARRDLPAGPVFCVLSGVTAGQRWSGSDVRRQLHLTAKQAGVTRRVAPHQFRHAHAVDLWREDINVYVIQKQLGHARLDVTATYLSGVAPVELVEPIGRRRAPLMPVSHSSMAKRSS